MGFVRSFNDFGPPARFDTIPFTHALVQEAAAAAGPWVTIQTIALSPVDADPANPAVRDFTTVNATLSPLAWYRIVWRDAALNTSAGDPVRWDESATNIASVSDVLRVMRIDSVSDPDQARIEAALRVAESWIKRQLHDANLGQMGATIVESFFGTRVVPYTGEIVSVYGIPYPNADPVLISSDNYQANGKQLRIMNRSWVWPGLPEDERTMSEDISNWEIRVTTDRSGVEVDPVVVDAVAFAAASLWNRGPRTAKGLTGESIGDYSYTVAQLRDGDPYFEEAKSLLRGLRRRGGIVVP